MGTASWTRPVHRGTRSADRARTPGAGRLAGGLCGAWIGAGPVGPATVAGLRLQGACG